ncbi:MAG: PAS domain S-box protein [Nitrospiraceae bacterium]|nr:PAS domain S-box protein [Nitrospiraceae bacterium]
MSPEKQKFTVRSAEGSSLHEERFAPARRLEEDLSLFQLLINQSNDAILIIRPETGQILYVNDKTCSSLGYGREELLAKKITDIAMNVRDRSSWMRLVNRVRAHGYALFETQQKRKNGSRFPVEVSVRHITHDEREYLVSVARDLTDRRRAEDVAIREKNKLEAVLGALGDGISVQDLGYRILYQNSRHRELYGNHAGEPCFRGYFGRDQVCDDCLLAQAFREGTVQRREVSAQADEGTVHREIIVCPVHDARGELFAGIEVVRDITERKRLESQLVLAHRLEAVGQLAGGVAHDFNNILTAIMGYGDILQEKLADNDAQEDVKRIILSAERAAQLTQSLLAFSRKQVIKIRPVGMNAIVQGMDKLLRRLAGKAIKVTVDLAREELVVRADSSQLEQVLMNLVTNARDAMPGGGRLDITTARADLTEEFRRTYGYGAPGTYAVLTVGDTGMGMDKQTSANIFEPFFTTKEVGRGTGLGLSLVYGVVKQHNGYITVQSRSGEGTRVMIYLPLSAESAAAAGAEDRAAVMRAGGSGTILIVEDDAGVRDLAAAVLTRAGYRVIKAVDGDDALKKFRGARKGIDLVILDVMMPRRNGREAYEAIQKIAPETKAMFMSGYAADSVRNLEIPGDGVHFLPKPFTAAQLLGMVRSLLAQQRPV